MKKITCFLIAVFYAVFLIGQTQIGADIDGEAVGDFSGSSVSLSSNGNIVAVGAPWNDGNGNVSGHVRVYENQSGTWVQLGQDIDGEALEDFSGDSVSLSSDGTIVAIGATENDENGTESGHVRIYENQSGIWVQLGQDIDGEASYDFSGLSNSLSSDGSTVAIGALRNDGNGTDSGHVRVYENQNDSWVQIGQDIDGEASGDFSGESVSLSSDGSTVAIGAPGNDGNGSNAGHVRIYENQSDIWIQVGQDIDGEALNILSGLSVSLSSDGSTVAIGAFRNDGNGTDSGHVRIYENQSDIWVQVGQDIDGETAGDESGISVNLSSDASVVVIGALRNDGSGSNAGHVRIYENQNDSWVQIGQDIDGEASGDFSGESVSLSSDGSTVAIGAFRNDGNGEDAGHVRVYDLNAVLNVDNFTRDFFSVVVDNQAKTISINLNDEQQLEQVNIFTITGKYLYSVKQQVIDSSGLSAGIYVVEVETSEGKSAKKIIID